MDSHRHEYMPDVLVPHHFVIPLRKYNLELQMATEDYYKK